MSGHKLVSISSLLSPRVDDIDHPTANSSFSNESATPSTLSVNRTFQSPFTAPLNPIPQLIPRPIQEVQIVDRGADMKRKISSPMSVMSLMNSPILEAHPEPISSTNDDIPTIPETTEAITKKKSNNTPAEKKEKPKKSAEIEKASTKEPEQSGPIIITIDIPLSTHNDVHTEHNFAKLVEEKYGSNETQAPLARGLWNFDGDDDDDDDDEEDADLDGETTAGPIPNITHNDEDEDDIVKALKIKFTPGMSDMEKESLVLKEIHRRKMVNNKRIGKYDVDDPFIDDEELEFEEETGANADGWFIWHGKLDISKMKKTGPETKIDKIKSAKSTSNTFNNTPSAQRSRSTNSASPFDFVSIAPANLSAVPEIVSTPEANKRRKAPALLSQPPTPKRIKKIIRSDTEKKENTEVKDTTKESPKETIAPKDAVEPPEDPKDAGSVGSKLIIGSFGFGA